MNTKHLLIITALLSATQTNTFVGVGVGRAIAQRLVAAVRARGAQTIRVAAQPENQKRALGTVAGGAAGYYITNEDDSLGQKVIKTGLGAGVGYAVAGTSQIGAIHSRVKAMHPRVKDLYQTAARKVDVKTGLSKTEAALRARIGSVEASMKNHTSQTAAELQGSMAKNLKHEVDGVKTALKKTEKHLADQMKDGFEKNQTLHGIAYKFMTRKK